MKVVNKHTRILTAATKVFAKKGFFNARISDIAKEAKVADGTIYLYFNNKDDILLSVLNEEIGKLIDQITKELAFEQNPEIKLEIFALKHLTAMKKNKNLAEVIHVELRQTSKLLKNFRNTTFMEYMDIIAEIVRQGQQEGVFRQDIVPDIAKRVFFGALDEVSRVWNTSLETHYTVEEAAYQMLLSFIAGISVRT